MAEELRLTVVTTANSKGLNDAAQDVEKLKDGTDDLAGSFVEAGDASDELSRALDRQGEEMHQSRVEASRLNAEIEQSSKRVKALQVDVLEMGNDKGLRSQLRQERSWLAELEKIRKELSGGVSIGGILGDTDAEGKKAGSALADGIGEGLKMGSAPIQGALIGLVVVASPAIGAMVAGAVVGAVGLGGIVGGVVAAAHDPRVKSAWHDLTATLTPESFGSKAFAQPTIDAIKLLKDGIADLHIGEVLGKGADAVPKLAAGLVAFAKGVMPGVSAAMDHADAIAGTLAVGLGQVGGAIGDVIKELAESPSTLEGLELIFQATSDAIYMVGDAAKFLGDAYHFIKGPTEELAALFATLFGWMPLMGDEFERVANRAAELGHAEGELKPRMDEVARGTESFGAAADYAAMKTGDLSAAWDILHGNFASADETLLAAKQAVDSLKDSVEENGRIFDGNSEAALKNRSALEKAAEKAAAAAEAYYKLTGDAAGANRIMQEQQAAAEKAAGATGRNKDQVHALANELFKLPPFVATTVQVTEQIDRLTTILRSRPRASGGPVFSGDAYIVGEHGPEPFVPSANGMILPNSSLRASGGDGAKLEVRLTWAPTGQRLVDAILEALRLEVQGLGGPVRAFA